MTYTQCGNQIHPIIDVKSGKRGPRHDHRSQIIMTVPEYHIVFKSYTYQYTKPLQSYMRKVAKGDQEATPKKPHDQKTINHNHDSTRVSYLTQILQLSVH